MTTKDSIDMNKCSKRSLQEKNNRGGSKGGESEKKQGYLAKKILDIFHFF